MAKFNATRAAKVLEAMDTVIRYMNDETGIDCWLANGVADGDSLEDIAEYFDGCETCDEAEQQFDEITECFYSVVKRYGKSGWWIPRKYDR